MKIQASNTNETKKHLLQNIWKIAKKMLGALIFFIQDYKNIVYRIEWHSDRYILELNSLHFVQ
jgi:single-stranded DNA-specific DHH superfamily exonuclease